MSEFKVAEEASAAKADATVIGNIKEKPHAVHRNNKKNGRGKTPSIKCFNL